MASTKRCRPPGAHNSAENAARNLRRGCRAVYEPRAGGAYIVMAISGIEARCERSLYEQLSRRQICDQ